MDSYVVPLSPSTANPRPIWRPRWKRSLVELKGKFEPKYRHDISGLLMQSYSEIRAFTHSYHIDGEPCGTHVRWFIDGQYMDYPSPLRKLGVSGLEFDSKGVYLASVTKLGCLTVHDFETLYCQATESLPYFKEYEFFLARRTSHINGVNLLNGLSMDGMKEDEMKLLLHISIGSQIDTVRWNIANQDEVACTSMRSSEVNIFDIGYISSKPVEVLRKRPTVTVHGSSVHNGFSDVAFTLHDTSRVLASDTYGVIDVWDRRTGDLPCLELTTNSNSTLNSIQLDVEEQIIFGASNNGVIHMWDLRGGRSAGAFQNHKEVCYSPITSMKLASLLDKIGSLKAQTNVVAKEIHSIDINPHCPYQLAFHLDDGWSGVIDINNFKVTHIHCPPPPWLDGLSDSSDLSYLRKPSWLPTHSIYAVGSSSAKGIHLLDFYPDASSPCHVDYDDNKHGIRHKQNRFVPLSESVTACATHPLNGTIIAGTKQSSLLMISQIRQSCQDGDKHTEE